MCPVGSQGRKKLMWRVGLPGRGWTWTGPKGWRGFRETRGCQALHKALGDRGYKEGLLWGGLGKWILTYSQGRCQSTWNPRVKVWTCLGGSPCGLKFRWGNPHQIVPTFLATVWHRMFHLCLWGAGTGEKGHWPWLSPLITEWQWVSFLTSLTLNFLLCMLEIIIAKHSGCIWGQGEISLCRSTQNSIWHMILTVGNSWWVRTSPPGTVLNAWPAFPHQSSQ